MEKMAEIARIFKWKLKNFLILIFARVNIFYFHYREFSIRSWTFWNHLKTFWNLKRRFTNSSFLLIMLTWKYLKIIAFWDDFLWKLELEKIPFQKVTREGRVGQDNPKSWLTHPWAMAHPKNFRNQHSLWPYLHTLQNLEISKWHFSSGPSKKCTAQFFLVALLSLSISLADFRQKSETDCSFQVKQKFFF